MLILLKHGQVRYRFFDRRGFPRQEAKRDKDVKRRPDGLVKYVAFDYLGKTYRFGARILTDEADEVISKLKGYLLHVAS
jgi:hypothetical protein